MTSAQTEHQIPSECQTQNGNIQEDSRQTKNQKELRILIKWKLINWKKMWWTWYSRIRHVRIALRRKGKQGLKSCMACWNMRASRDKRVLDKIDFLVENLPCWDLFWYSYVRKYFRTCTLHLFVSLSAIKVITFRMHVANSCFMHVRRNVLY